MVSMVSGVKCCFFYFGQKWGLEKKVGFNVGFFIYFVYFIFISNSENYGVF